MVSQHNPVQIYVSHAWVADDDYHRVFEYLSGARNFFYTHSSDPDKRPAGGREPEREVLRKQIAPAEAVIVLASQHQQNAELIEFQATFTKASDKPLILLAGFGAAIKIPKVLTDLADEQLDWDERKLVDAIRRQARHEETTRWDSIDFTPD
jgi:hypothetical protein